MTVWLYANQGEWLCGKKFNYSFNRTCWLLHDIIILFISHILQRSHRLDNYWSFSKYTKQTCCSLCHRVILWLIKSSCQNCFEGKQELYLRKQLTVWYTEWGTTSAHWLMIPLISALLIKYFLTFYRACLVNWHELPAVLRHSVSRYVQGISKRR
jgi:hypothetical protein